MSRRGTSNGNVSGNSADRARRRQWLLDEFGNGVRARCRLNYPGVCVGWVDVDTLTVDRIVPGYLGGRYVRGNIQPGCGPCQSHQGGLLGGRRRRGKPQ